MRRRDFAGLTGATVIGAMLDGIPRPSREIDAESLAPVLAGHPSDFGASEAPPSIAALTAAANAARRHYQACRYGELTKHELSFWCSSAPAFALPVSLDRDLFRQCCCGIVECDVQKKSSSTCICGRTSSV